MARMYPALEGTLIDDHISERSEAYVYRKLAKIDNEFHVYHSVRYVDFSPSSKKPEGECDFVIFHRRLGLLVFEVKGGRITCESGQWYTSGKRGKAKIYPYKQARTNLHVIVDKLRGVHNIREKFSYGYAVCFPDSKVPHGSQSLHNSTLESKDVTLGASDLQELEKSLPRIMKKWKGGRTIAPMSKGTFDAIGRVLERRFDLASSLQRELDAANSRLITLDKDQIRFLDFMQQQPKAALEGPAGSGKTILATEKARRVAEEGGRVLLLTYNVPLADKLSKDLRTESHVTVSNVHRWGMKLIRRTGVSSRVAPLHNGGELNDSFFKEDFPDLLLDAIDISRKRYDALIIDEGQDFLPTTLTALQTVLKENGCFYVFFDPHQDVYDTHEALDLPTPPYPLGANYRSPRSVVDFTKSRTQIPVNSHRLSIQGTRPKVIPTDASAFLSKLKEYVEEMISAGVSPKEVCIIVQNADRFLNWLGETRLGRHDIVAEELSTQDAIRAVSLKRFKGLECDIAAICDIKGVSAVINDKKEYYVALTRAKFAARVFRVQ